jgi:hypothetical protein
VTLGQAHGFRDEPFELSMSAESPTAVIRYTVNGKEPTRTTGKTYVMPLAISKTTVVRAAAFEEGKAGSRVVTRSYVFPAQVIKSSRMDRGITGSRKYGPKMRDSLLSLPSMVITTGRRINGTSETFGSLEFIPADGAEGFQVNAGIRYFGGAWTNFDKKNFRIYFRKKYGVGKLRYPLFDGFDNGVEPVREFDQLNLRTGSHDMVQRGFYMSNRFTDDTMLEMGNLNPHGRFVHLYLNGDYWGMYHLRERWNADMLANYLGGAKADYEAINGNWDVGGWADPGDPYDGDGLAWKRIKSLRGSYEKISPYLDVTHYIDYMLVYMFGKAEAEYRCVGPPTRRWSRWDLQHAAQGGAPGVSRAAGRSHPQTLVQRRRTDAGAKHRAPQRPRRRDGVGVLVRGGPVGVSQPKLVGFRQKQHRQRLAAESHGDRRVAISRGRFLSVDRCAGAESARRPGNGKHGAAVVVEERCDVFHDRRQ